MRNFANPFRAAVASLGLVLASAAGAQTTQSPSAPNMPAPGTTIPEKIQPAQPGDDGPGTTGSTRPGENLSDTLNRTDGVLKPREGMDSGLQVRPPVPDPGTTPVIPPPGTPGGNPTVEPK